jgi:hypothetical protein
VGIEGEYPAMEGKGMRIEKEFTKHPVSDYIKLLGVRTQ